MTFRKRKAEGNQEQTSEDGAKRLKMTSNQAAFDNGAPKRAIKTKKKKLYKLKKI